MTNTIYLCGAVRVEVEDETGAVLSITCAATGADADGLYRRAYLQGAIAHALLQHRCRFPS